MVIGMPYPSAMSDSIAFSTWVRASCVSADLWFPFSN